MSYVTGKELQKNAISIPVMFLRRCSLAVPSIGAVVLRAVRLPLVGHAVAVLAFMGLGILGLVLGVVFLLLWRGAKKRGENRQTLFLLLAVLGGLLALAGAVTLVLFLLMLY